MIHAVLAGINIYPDAPLNFCIKDIDDVLAYLQTNGLLASNTIVLKDSQATKENLLDALRNKIAQLKAGDVLYFHFSGHGTQIPNTNDAWEADGMDEVICPYFVEYNPNAFISDNELFEIFSQKEANAMIVFTPDSCHSGDIGRNIKKVAGNSKFLKLPEWLQNFFSNAPKSSTMKAYNYTLPNVVVVSACASKETAQDGGAGIQNGRFTDALLKSLKANPTQTFEALVFDLQTRCKFAQTPQLQCTKMLRKKTFLNAKPVRTRAKKI